MKMHKRWALLCFFCVLSSALCFADGGSGTSGGGAKIRTEFRLRAYEVIDMVSNYPAAVKACSPELLTSTLEQSKILVVDVLVDRNTGKPIEAEDLDAWSTTREIQLKKAAWESHFASQERLEAVDRLILHELFRATGRCNDEDEKISVGAIKRSESQFVLTFLMRKFESIYYYETSVKTPPNYWYSDGEFRGICEDIKVGATCFSFSDHTWGKAQLVTLESLPGPSRELNLIKHTNFYPDNKNIILRVQSIFDNLTESDRVRVVFDRQSGSLAIGVVGGKMIPIVQ